MREYQAIIAAPGFALGVRCNDEAVTGIDFLAAQPAQAARTPLAIAAEHQLCAYLSDPTLTFSLPVCATGTLFQHRVWKCISAIAVGQTASYGQLAKALNNAPRAVGQACAANPLPLLVPCHRVIASSGVGDKKLGGFAGARGGLLLDIKRWLLTHENRQFTDPRC